MKMKNESRKEILTNKKLQVRPLKTKELVLSRTTYLKQMEPFKPIIKIENKCEHLLNNTVVSPIMNEALRLQGSGVLDENKT